ncbi:hypothetical protein NC651_038549 [Populus alba x Populus x berolinensis]|nr:hypothetical protein NC651_038549 [Populus alba x Populus x berolinensis]
MTFRFLPNTSCYNCWEKLLAPPPLGNRMDLKTVCQYCWCCPFATIDGGVEDIGTGAGLRG